MIFDLISHKLSAAIRYESKAISSSTSNLGDIYLKDMLSHNFRQKAPRVCDRMSISTMLDYEDDEYEMVKIDDDATTARNMFYNNISYF